MPSDSVEYYAPIEFDENENDHTWADKGARREYVGFPFFYKYYPSYKAWKFSESGIKPLESYPTKKMENTYYLFFHSGNYSKEKHAVFQKFKYASFNPPLSHSEGSSLNWDCQSTLSLALHKLPAVVEGLASFKTVITTWLKTHEDLDGLFLNGDNFGETENINLSSINALWAFQIFGGTQGRKVAIRKLNKIQSPCITEGGEIATKSYELELIYTIYDIFGNGQSDGAKWWFPGLVELWVLQHYRNWDCDNAPCYIPITNHSVNIIDKSILCVTNQ